MNCMCDICRYARKVQLVRNYGNTAAKQTLIDELYERLAHAEMDVARWESIRNGTWYNARNYAEAIIKQCDALDAKE